MSPGLSDQAKRASVKLVTALVFAAGLWACKADDPSGDGDGDGDDAGADDVLASPLVDSLPTSTPLATVAIRGATDGTRVVAQNTADGSLLAAVLPGGGFCIDAPLLSSGATEMNLYAVGGDGRVSAPALVSVTRDVGAATPSNPTCSGTGTVDCDGPEICDNEIDDDCNGYEDQCDTACNGCIEDVFEPNDVAVDVPMIEAGLYTLQVCPCRDDWFAFQRGAARRILVAATFDGSAVNINLRLYKANPGGLGEGDLVAFSFTNGDREDIDFLTEEAGLYYLRIYSSVVGVSASYDLAVN